MSQASEKIIRRIKQLLALGTNNPNENEAAIAMRRAHALLAEYNLSLADMTEEEKKSADPYTRREQIRKERFRSYQRLIANAIAQLYFCKMFYSRRTNHDVFTFVGRESNVAIAEMVSDSVIKTLVALAKAQSLGHAGFQTNFMVAASRRVAVRCAQMINEAEKGETKTEEGKNLPALRSTYLAEQQGADKYIAENVGKLGESKSRAQGGRGGHDGHAAGDAAGRSVSLRPGLGSDMNGRKALK